MALGGLWHGAAWNFVVWGIYHGVCLVVHRECSQLIARSRMATALVKSKLGNVLSKWLTFNAVSVGCVFFGMPNIRIAFTMLRKMFLLHPLLTSMEGKVPLLLKSDLPIFVPVTVCMALALVLLNIPVSKLIESGVLKPKSSRLTAAYCTVLILLMVMFISDTSSPFIYFQF
jgi:alginate O-acetyltransferase complex protein AlgI